MITAKEYWKERFDEYPQTDADKLAIAMMAEYADKVVKNNLVKPNVMFENMQYYMEYCQMKGYVTPQEWLEKHKHF